MKNKYQKMMNEIKPDDSLNQKVIDQLEKPKRRINLRPLQLILSVAVVFVLLIGFDTLFLAPSRGTDSSPLENNHSESIVDVDPTTEFNIGHESYTLSIEEDFSLAKYHFSDGSIIESYASHLPFTTPEASDDAIVLRFESNGFYYVLIGPKEVETELYQLQNYFEKE